MPKLKTSRGAAKRFKLTARGKVKRSRAYRRHILGTKTRKRKRGLKRSALLAGKDARAVRRLLPYAF